MFMFEKLSLQVVTLSLSYTSSLFLSLSKARVKQHFNNITFQSYLSCPYGYQIVIKEMLPGL